MLLIPSYLSLRNLLLLVGLHGGRLEAILLAAGVVAGHVVVGGVGLGFFDEVDEGETAFADLAYLGGGGEAGLGASVGSCVSG